MTIPNDPGRLPSAYASPDGVDLDRVWTQATAAAANVHVYLPCLAVAACCAGIVDYATRPQREF